MVSQFNFKPFFRAVFQDGAECFCGQDHKFGDIPVCLQDCTDTGGLFGNIVRLLDIKTDITIRNPHIGCEAVCRNSAVNILGDDDDEG